MPSRHHESLLELFRNRPELAVELLRDSLGIELPAYTKVRLDSAVALRARYECPVCVMAVTVTEAMARWAARPIELGPGSIFTPLVVGPKGVPAVTEPEEAERTPELAVLSAMAHGQGDVETVVKIALAAARATSGLDDERAMLYNDMIMAALSQAARKELSVMREGYEYQSDFARKTLASSSADAIPRAGNRCPPRPTVEAWTGSATGSPRTR